MGVAFYVAVTALSLPSPIMIGKVVKPRLLAIFGSNVTAWMIITGYLFNALL